MQVSEVLRVKGNALFTVTPDSMLSDCIVTMAEHDVGSLVVMDHGRLAGMLTFREVLRVLARRQLEHRSGPTPPMAEIVVKQVMKSDPLVVSPQTEINELRRIMLDTRQRYVPVMEDTTLLGVVSFHDVARAVLEEQGFENRMLKAYIRNSPSEI